MAKPLTSRKVETIKPGELRREIPDALLPGFYLLIQPSGRRSFAVRTRIRGKPVKITVGRAEVFTLAEARERAREILREVASGRDPRDAKHAERPDVAKLCFEKVLEDFAKVYARDHRSADHVRSMIELYAVPAWRGCRVNEISQTDVSRLLFTLADDKPVAANRLLSSLRLLFAWAVNRTLIAANPTAGIKKPTRETARERTLDDVELADLWRASEHVAYPMRDITRLLVLTGLRRGEVSEGKWSEISLEQRLWTVPAGRAKNRRDHLLPLSPAVVEILGSLPRFKTAPDFLFPAMRGGNGAFSGFGKAKERLDGVIAFIRQEHGEHKPMEPWVLHDLRRSIASGLQRLQFPIEVTEAVLGHVGVSRAGIKGIYNRHDYAPEKKRALNAWARHVLGLIRQMQDSNVVELAPSRARALMLTNG